MIALCQEHYIEICKTLGREIPVLCLEPWPNCHICNEKAVWYIDQPIYEEYLNNTVHINGYRIDI